MNSVIAEEWKDIEGYEGLYQISNKGRVKSLVGWNGHKYISREKILKPSKTSTGYWKVDLHKNGKKKSLKLHRVIASAFIPNPNNLPFINHIDSNPLNNSLENLEWCTPKYNSQYSYEHGNHKRKINEKDAIELYNGDGTTSVTRVAKALGVSTTCASAALKRAGVPIIQNPSRFGINVEAIKAEFDNGFTNKQLAEKYGCSRNLIARRRYQYNRGMI